MKLFFEKARKLGYVVSVIQAALIAVVALVAAACVSLTQEQEDALLANLDRLYGHVKGWEKTRPDTGGTIDAVNPIDGEKPPVVAGSMNDEIDLASVVYHGPVDIRSWPATSELPRGVYVSGSNVNFPHSRAGAWSTNSDGIEGNVWAIVKHGGKWRMASWEWLRKGQTSKPWTKIENGHFKVSDLSGYQIKQGEEVYIIAAGLSRGNERGTKERTKATKVRW